jgi:hypothetical protein
MLLFLKTETEPASKTSCFFKKIGQRTNPPLKKKKIVSVNFPHALFSLLDFLTLEAGTVKLS